MSLLEELIDACVMECYFREHMAERDLLFHDTLAPHLAAYTPEASEAKQRDFLIHHCMRLIGVAERALELMCRRALGRTAFGRPVADQGVTRERIANASILIDQARFLVLNAAQMMDTVGNKGAKKEIAMIKVAAPAMACQVIDWAMQVHGGAGVSEDFPLAAAYASARTLRFADGPDEVHRNQIGKLELARYQNA